jgi:hypothetical protein
MRTIKMSCLQQANDRCRSCAAELSATEAAAAQCNTCKGLFCADCAGNAALFDAARDVCADDACGQPDAAAPALIRYALLLPHFDDAIVDAAAKPDVVAELQRLRARLEQEAPNYEAVPGACFAWTELLMLQFVGHAAAMRGHQDADLVEVVGAIAKQQHTWTAISAVDPTADDDLII